MCLANAQPVNRHEQDAWKIFVKIRDEIQSFIITYDPLTPHVWLQANVKRIVNYGRLDKDLQFTPYDSGFHAFNSYEDAFNYQKTLIDDYMKAYPNANKPKFELILKIRIKGIHTQGIEPASRIPCLVASEMMILETEDNFRNQL